MRWEVNLERLTAAEKNVAEMWVFILCINTSAPVCYRLTTRILLSWYPTCTTLTRRWAKGADRGLQHRMSQHFQLSCTSAPCLSFDIKENVEAVWLENVGMLLRKNWSCNWMGLKKVTLGFYMGERMMWPWDCPAFTTLYWSWGFKHTILRSVTSVRDGERKLCSLRIIWRTTNSGPVDLGPNS